jgi:hypothetical protein
MVNGMDDEDEDEDEGEDGACFLGACFLGGWKGGCDDGAGAGWVVDADSAGVGFGGFLGRGMVEMSVIARME